MSEYTKWYRIHIKAYGKGVKEAEYKEEAYAKHTAVARAMKRFNQDFKHFRADETIITVRV